MVIDTGTYKDKSELRSMCYDYDCSVTAATIHPGSLMDKYNVKYLFLASEPSHLAKEDENAFRPRRHADWISLCASDKKYCIIQKFVQTENEYQI